MLFGGTVVVLLLVSDERRRVRQRERLLVGTLTSLYDRIMDAAASGPWPKDLKQLRPYQEDVGEIVLWDLLASENRPLCCTPRATMGAHSGLCQAALLADLGTLPYLAESGPPHAPRGIAVLVHTADLPTLAITWFRAHAFTEHETTWCATFSRLLTLGLENAAARHRTDWLADVIYRLDRAPTARAAATEAVEAIAEEFGDALVSVLRYDDNRFRPVAASRTAGEEASWFIETGFAESSGLLWHAYTQQRPVFIDRYADHPAASPLPPQVYIGRTAVVPLTHREGARNLLTVAGLGEERWRPEERELLKRTGQLIGWVLERRFREDFSTSLLQYERELLNTSTDVLPGRLLEVAVSLVDGADAGTLLVREGGAYRFVASYGHDYGALKEWHPSEDEVLIWYAADRGHMLAGEPRLLVAPQGRSIFDRVAEGHQEYLPADFPSPVANLCLPILEEDEVMAIVNFDSLTDRYAFGADALEAVRALQPLIAFVLQSARLRELLSATAATDSLTGLLNRRAFDEQIQHAVAAAQRYGTSIALLLMDMRGFKAINDRYGHLMGDEMLKRVATTLGHTPRAGDTVYRWGGDEFAALLRNVDPAEALNVAERFVADVGAIDLLEEAPAITIGIATYPEDAPDIPALLNVADSRLYRAKKAGLSVVGGADPSPEPPTSATGDSG